MRFLAFMAMTMLPGVAFAQYYAPPVYHQGYTNPSGTYVQPHYQTAPNANPYDNYSTRGNVNPYTGQQGTVNPQPSYGYQSPSYSYQPRPAQRR